MIRDYIFLKMDSVGKSIHGAKYECLLFDMDDTLYPMSTGLNLACRKNIEGFMLQHLHMEEAEVPRLCLELYKEYGTTMAGLKGLGYEIDNDEFHAYVHGRLPYEVLKPDPALRNLILSLPQKRKIIFTNADKAHRAQVLSRLGLEDCFEGIICFETLNPPLEPVADCISVLDHGDAVLAGGASEANATGLSLTDGRSFSSKSRVLCKPSVEAIEAAIRTANINPKKTIFFDDSVRNIASGKAACYRGELNTSARCRPCLEKYHNIKEALPEIWEGEGGQIEQVIQPSAVATVILA